MPDEGWRLNPEERTLTRAMLVYRYSEITRSGVPIEWHEQLSDGGWKAVTDADLLSSLNMGWQSRMAILEDRETLLQRRKEAKGFRRRRR